MKIWQETIIVYLVAASMVYIFGSKKQFVGFVIVIIVLVQTIYLIEKKKKLSHWQERIISYLIVFPLLYFFIPVGDLLALFAGSIIIGLIIAIIERRKEKGGQEEGEREMLPEWEGEENRKKGDDASGKAGKQSKDNMTI